MPLTENKISYTEKLEKMLSNLYRPGIPIIIESIRVVDEKDIPK